MPLRPRIDQAAKLVDVALTKGALGAPRAGEPFSLRAFRLVSQVRARFGAGIGNVSAREACFACEVPIAVIDRVRGTSEDGEPDRVRGLRPVTWWAVRGRLLGRARRRRRRSRTF